MTKAYSIFLSILFSLFIGGILVASLLLPKVEFSQTENRYLQKTPEFSVETVTNGTFMADAEDYVSDHIVGRDFWVALKAWSERLSGKKENEGVYFGAEDTLINKVAQPDMADLSADMEHIDRLVSNVDVPVYFGLIPSAAAIWSDRLPANAPTADELDIIQTLYGKTLAESVDLYSLLVEHSSEYIYYRTDHHWTSLGAYYGYVALLESMGMTPVALDSLDKTTVSTEFYGTTYSTSGVRWVDPDQIDTYVSEDGISVTSYFTGQPEAGHLYAPDFLEKKDKYSYFLGGNQPLCVIETQQIDAPKILIVRDSYSDALTPFLTESFSEIHLYDLRYNKLSLKDYVQENQIDTVVVLYSISNFATDDNLFFLGR